MKNFLPGDVAHSIGMVIKVDEIRTMFDQGGCMKEGPVMIQLKDNSKPHCVTMKRRIPFPILPKVKA